MFEDLSVKLEGVLKKIRGQGKITEKNIDESLREIRRVLFDADVNYKVVKDFLEEVKQKSLGENVLLSITPGQLIVKIINDELIKLLGSENVDINFSNEIPSVILVVGLQGSGKTTFSAKLAKLLKKRGKTPLLAACDIYRPAAIEQLKILGKQADIPVFSIDGERDAIKIAQTAIRHAKNNARDTLIIDTAGRLAIDEEMMNEVRRIKDAVKPAEILFVVDSMTGQDAVNTAKSFHDQLDFNGVVLTKLDGDSRGGAALSIRSVVDKPIKFASVGEKLDQLEAFFPDRMASRILGKGDIVSFVEKAQQEFDQDESAKLQEKLRKNKFDFEDFLAQLKQIKKMGSLSSIVSMLPGAGNALKGKQIDDKVIVKIEAVILSMTSDERSNPRILNGSRRRRIANGSGNSIQEVNRVIRQFEDMQKMMKNFNKSKLFNTMRKMNIPPTLMKNLK
ncbi:MAG: signal recognition particle protein [Ignavibacteriaceae bacterium]|jgi:signal recognition particle subunit SRP54|nr:MAG: signal recognition particle protein [Chlorobiota bacterium]KXK03729.1 MAG: Signal recognition particle subunit SRP54 [Chlorobi bacterium OLB4]MBV6398877.1 Signal recognition particle protein [Ignavibacteria bacterium]MCC6886286.1 signal recognition particle protein [Ignavibacteriales bacterium]MCE7952261.1 signal recognition particle protein [Chlorobi bacterium CHB7]MEB2328933.1 signal recognition particle protein [Ignavibacteriaceae bacterium]OQY77008.1 MAG: signal recognition partic